LKSGYQLFRQQALAEGLARSGLYDPVVSALAFDERNVQLVGCLSSTGIEDVRVGWGRLFNGRSTFAAFSHQKWVRWVRDSRSASEWSDWLRYVSERYGY
jgi:hypothetical protein